jgi:hypothetical protein
VVASKDTRQDSVTGHRSGDRDTAAGPAAVERLVDGAARLWLRAPELALALGEHAAGLAEAAGADDVWLRAETVVVDARVRLGHRAGTVGRAVAALRLAEDAGQAAMGARLRANLAVCARSVGAPLTGLAVLRPALTTAVVPGTVRAFALAHLVGCMGRLGRAPGLVRVLAEADRLCTADDDAEDDVRLVARALVRVAVSAFRRRHGDLVGAADAARKGLALLDELGDRAADGGVARVRLVLELVCSLLDLGHTAAALDIAQPLLDEPPRAAGVAPVGWLRLAVATRIHVPAGDTSGAARLLRDAVHSSTRHDLHALSARLWLELATIEERLNLPGEALHCMQRARAAEQAHTRIRRQANALLTGEFGAGEQAPVELEELLSGTRRTESAPTPRAGAQAVDVRSGDAPDSYRGAPETVPSETAASETAASAAVAPGTRSAETVPAEPDRPQPEGSEIDTVAGGFRDEPATSAGTWAQPDPAPAEQAVSSGAEPAQHEPPQYESPQYESPRYESARPESRPSGGRRAARHDSEHGSLTARSVLDRLGISPSGSGGRRRAADEGQAEDETAPHGTAPHEDATVIPVRPLSRPDPPATPQPEPESALDPTRAPESEPEPRKVTDEWITSDPFGESEGVSDPWLPKLRLPPSLDSIAGLDLDQTSGTDEPGSDIDDGYQAALAADEPPPGAGLADLLARALAEHRAGSSSASALVKRLGEDKSEFDEPPRINGRHRTDD